MRTFLSLLLALVLPLTLLSGCRNHGDSGSDPEIIEFEAQTWTLSFSGAERSGEGSAARYFADAIYEATNGAVTVTLHPFDGLTDGDPQAGFQGVADGSISLGLYSSLTCEQQDSRLGAVSLPFLFSSSEDAAARLDGDAGDALGEVLAEYGLHSLGIGESGFRCPTNSLSPITSPADLRGRKLRVTDSPLIQEAYRLWGADCITANWPLVFTALRTGTYDGQEEFLVTADAASVQSVQKYLTRWTGIYGCLYFFMNEELYSSLSPALQSIVDRCGRDAVAYQRQQHLQEEADILSQWAKAKVTVTELTAEETAAFRQAAQPCYDRFARDYPELSARLVPETETP